MRRAEQRKPWKSKATKKAEKKCIYKDRGEKKLSLFLRKAVGSTGETDETYLGMNKER